MQKTNNSQINDIKNRKILIVEDELVTAIDIKEKVESCGFIVVGVATKFDEAISFTKEHDPDLILMDVKLQGKLSGIDAAIEIKKFSKVPIVYITAYSDEATLEYAKVSEPYGFIIKPYSEKDLISTIEIALHKVKIEKDTYSKERRFSIILNSIGDGVIVTNSNGQVDYMNKAAENITDYSKSSAKGKNIDEILNFNKDKLSIINNLVIPITDENKDIFSNEIVIKSNTGKEYFIEYDVSRLTNDIEKNNGNVFVLRDISERKSAEEERKHTLSMLRNAIDGSIKAMAMTVERRDPYTAGHQRRVTDLARAIAQEMGLSKYEINGIRMAGVIHDLGKISIPAEILAKPGRLSDIEFSLIKTHCQVGYDILKTIDFPWPVAQIVYQHHERVDGKGYPRGVGGNSILLEARIIAVADVVEAMASHRPYRASLGLELALEEITKNKKILFDETVVNACLSVIKSNGFTFTS